MSKDALSNEDLSMDDAPAATAIATHTLWVWKWISTAFISKCRDGEIKKLTASIEETEQEIRKVNQKLKHIEDMLQKPSADWTEDDYDIYGSKEYLREEKKQLLEEENKLREKKNQLREEENQLREEENQLRGKKNKLLDKKRLQDEQIAALSYYTSSMSGQRT